MNSSLTLVGEGDRKMLKTVIKHSVGDNIRHRIIPTDVLTRWVKKMVNLKPEVASILQEEKEEKQVCPVLVIFSSASHFNVQIRRAEMELRKSQNMIDHEAEIFSRPARTWFQTEKERSKAAGPTNDFIEGVALTVVMSFPCIAVSKQHHEQGAAISASSKKKATSGDISKVSTEA